MTVTEKEYKIICLEYRQERDDEFYGSCLYARFYFNLDKYELTIISDCGNYGYKWVETPDTESFLELMARCGSDYIIRKIYGKPDEFDYDTTIECIRDYIGDDNCEMMEEFERIKTTIESEYIPDTGQEFVRMFDEENYNGTFCNTFELPVYVYPYDVKKICKIFEESIKPKIKEILNR